LLLWVLASGAASFGFEVSILEAEGSGVSDGEMRDGLVTIAPWPEAA
jgi:hypothetical protein